MLDSDPIQISDGEREAAPAASESRSRPRVARLDPGVVAKIAAGEMILRPASVVKELVENALDAGARRIDVAIGERPDAWLEVSDDGVGMDREDLLLSLEPHATSKLRAEEDLLRVATLGFRGEALASIGRVSRLEIRTSSGSSDGGLRVVVEGGDRRELTPIARPRGTSVRVEQLFFNSPVRKRFLKTPTGEMRVISRLLAALSLAYAEVGFRLSQQDRVLMELPSANDLLARLAQIHGGEIVERLLPLDYSTPRGRIFGFIGVPELARPGAAQQTLLVNRRWVSASWVGAALRQGFGDLLPAMRQPFAALLLESDPSRIDVNVHPTKREVRFFDESFLFGDMSRATRQALGSLVPSWSLDPDDVGGSRVVSASAEPRGNASAHDRPDVTWTRTHAESWPLLFGAGVAASGESAPSEDAPHPGDAAPGDGVASHAAVAAPIHPASTTATSGGLAPVWQLHERYLLAQTRQGLLIVDQHAAHERVLYEEALQNLNARPAPTQLLLFPKVIALDPQEWEVFSAQAADLSRLGIEADDFGGRSVLLRGVPSLWGSDPEGFFHDVLSELSHRPTRNGEERRRQLAASFACRSAIKSGQSLGLEEMNFLIDRLFATQTPHGDPHGRPTFVTVSMEDLDRRFGRSH